MNSTNSSAKDAILSRLLDAVKQCQIRFGGKTELATELDSRVICLCSAWESVLSHGLKHTNKALSTLKQVSEITGLTRISSTRGLSILGEIKNIETEPAFWHCIKEALSEHEKQRYALLKKVTTDEGKGRAWLRSALNEHSLERYLHMIIDDKNLLQRHFEDWSVMRDMERVNMLPNMAGGLGSILFAISIDNEDLNSIKPATGLDAIMSSTPPVTSAFPPRVDDEPRPVIAAEGSPTAERKKRKKKSKKPVKIVSFDEGDSSISASPASSVASSAVTSPRTTSSGIDFTSIASIVTSGGAGRGGVSRQGSTDSQTSLSSGPQFRPQLPKQGSTDSVSSATGRVTGTHSRSGRSGATCSGGSHEKICVSENAQHSDWSESFTGESKLPATLPVDERHQENSAASRVVERLVVTEFSNPFDDESKAGTALGSANNEAEQPSTSSAQPVKTKIASQGSVDSVCSNTVPDIVTLSLDTPLTVGDTYAKSHHSQPLAYAAPTNAAPVNNYERTNKLGAADVRHNTAAYIEELLNPGTIDQATIAEEDEAQLAAGGISTEVESDSAAARVEDAEEEHAFPPQKSVQPPKGKPNIHKRTQSWTSNNSNVSAASAASDSSAVSFNNDIDIPSNLTPLGPEGILDETHRSASFCCSDELSVDSSDVQHTGYNDMTYNAAVALAMAQKGLSHSDSHSSFRTQGDGSNAPDPIITSSDTLTSDELKQAVIAMMMRKDEVEEQNRHIRAMFETEIEVSCALRAELEEAKKSHLVKQERDAEKTRALSRENELLKHQLKKYVNAVQMLRRQGATAEDFPGIHIEDDPQPPIPPPISAIDYSSEASEYEQKLIQVAEMHGELMEFNELLHKQLLSKDNYISRLKQELVDLRGPLPGDIPGDDISIISMPSEYSLSRALIHIWIPSAFLRGTGGSDGYHVYQVYVRIKDEEWNIYRRYTEFNEVHNKLRKKFSIVNTMNFPKKKAIGNKDPKFVEERRKQLQAYIRNVTNLLTQSDQALAANPCKKNLLEVAPFFGDVATADKKGKGRGKNRTRRAGGGAVSSASPSPGTSDQQYMGL